MRIEQVEQRFGQLGKIIVKPLGEVRIEEGDSLQQPLDMRIL